MLPRKHKYISSIVEDFKCVKINNQKSGVKKITLPRIEGGTLYGKKNE